MYLPLDTLILAYVINMNIGYGMHFTSIYLFISICVLLFVFSIAL